MSIDAQSYEWKQLVSLGRAERPVAGRNITRWIKWASQVQIKGTQRRLILLQIAIHANGLGYAELSRKQLEFLTGIGQRCIRRRLEDLESLGLIRRHSQEDYTEDGRIYYYAPQVIQIIGYR